MIRKLPSVKYLRECIRYEPDSGKLFWKRRPPAHFTSRRGFNTWNTRYAGCEAFTSKNKKGHLSGAINKVLYLAHRVIWKIQTGKEPPSIIDHKDRNGGNNRWNNLRAATNGQNRINSSKARGVHCKKGRWRAYITYDGTIIHLGSFGSEQAALAARKIAEQKWFGEFAP